MKRSLIIALVFISCLLGSSRANEKNRGAGDEVVYLHCFSPTYGQKIAVATNTSKDKTPETQPSRLVTLKVHVGHPFETINDSMHYVSGQITTDAESHVATLEGAFGSGFKFSGKIELEKAFDPDATWFSGAVFPCRCVFSKNKDITPFLKEQTEADAKKLQAARELTRKNKDPLEKRKAEQSGTDQSVRAAESKAERYVKPKVESEKRSE